MRSKRALLGAPAGAAPPIQLEHCQALVVGHDRFAIDDAGAHVQRANGLGNVGEMFGEVVAISREQADAAAMPVREDTESVVLDLVNLQPGPVGGRWAGRGRQGSKRGEVR